MPQIQIKPVDQIIKKWQARAGGAASDYAAGIQNPRRPQAETAAAASQTWAAGVQQAVANNTFAKNVLASKDKYIRNATGKGAARYPQGIQSGGADFQNGISKYLTVLSNVTLPPRMPKGDPGNLQRVAAVDQALRAAKLQG